MIPTLIPSIKTLSPIPNGKFAASLYVAAKETITSFEDDMNLMVLIPTPLTLFVGIIFGEVSEIPLVFLSIFTKGFPN